MSFDTSSRARTRTETITSISHTSRSGRVRARLALAGARGQTVVWSALRRAASWSVKTITAGGWVAAVVAVTGVALGLALGLPEWLAAGIAAAVLLLIAALFLFGANAYEVDLGVLEDHVVAGEHVTGDIAVRNVSKHPALPGRVEIPIGDALAEAAVPLLLPGAGHREQLAIPAQRRGVIDVGPVRSVRGDPIGLLHRIVVWSKKHVLYVHPKTVTLPTTNGGFLRDLEGIPSATLVSDDISFHAIRQYQPGDAPRNVHWKSSAKTGTLMVRQYEESRRSKICVLLGLAEPEYAEADEFELAVSAAASIGVRLIRDRREVEVVVSDDVPEAARKIVRSARRLATFNPQLLLNDFSGVDSSERKMSLDQVATLAAHEIDGLSLAFLVCGSSMTLADLQLVAHRFDFDTAVVIVRVDLDAEPGVRQVGDLTVFTLGALDDLTHLMSRVVQS
ncbi:DUF58 domain-containing protein [Pseudoclavibacter soli]|uniref:DUF58 domain-containing protein n=1 Tax=Pseudoclavibacter soli TaxID=452623 RepID=UPI000415A53E|nr:DUF58 domain-containing protein [Pseudoclavibacter soli]